MTLRSSLAIASLAFAIALPAATVSAAPAGLTAPAPADMRSQASGKPMQMAQRQFRGGGATRGGGFRGGARPAFRAAPRNFAAPRATRPAYRVAPQQRFRGNALAPRPRYRAAPVYRGARPVVGNRRIVRNPASYPRYRGRRAGYRHYYRGWWYAYPWWLPAAAVGVGVGVPVYTNSCAYISRQCAWRHGYPSYGYDICMQDNGCY